jgi:hypothetical protein
MMCRSNLAAKIKENTMKRYRTLSLITIFFLGLALNAAADSNQSGKIKLSDHVVVAGTQLEPGDYVVRWKGNGPEVEVSFLQNGNEVLSVRGTLLEKNNRQNSFTTTLDEDGSRILNEIAFSKLTLVIATPAPQASQ